MKLSSNLFKICIKFTWENDQTIIENNPNQVASMLTKIFNVNRTSSVINIVLEIFYKITYHAYHFTRSEQKASVLQNFSNVIEIAGWLSCDQFCYKVHDN